MTQIYQNTKVDGLGSRDEEVKGKRILSREQLTGGCPVSYPSINSLFFYINHNKQKKLNGVD
jgi:hypothetical protein